MKGLIDDWDRNAERNEDDNFRFLTWLKGSPNPERVDRVAKETHDAVFAAIDCTKCANCCKVYTAAVSDSDIERLAKFFELSEQEFILTYLSSADGQFVIRSLPCPFLKDDKCSIYDIRPDACRGYPYTREDEFATRRYMRTENTLKCRAVYHIVGRMKKRLNWRPRRR